MKEFLKSLKKFFSKIFTRFSNYRNTKKRFVVYLVILTIGLLFPLVRVNALNGGGGYSLFSMWRSLIIIAIALIGLFCRNLSVSFKTEITKLCALREDEPLVDFILLWIIVSVFMGIMDMASIASSMSQSRSDVKINLSTAGYFDCLLLLGGLVRSCINLWKTSQKDTKKTKIMNVLDDHHQNSNQKPNKITHLFDDLGDE